MNYDPNVPVIVIPYRDRKDHLTCILTRFEAFPVVVVEQEDQHRFNRGALLNIGFNEALTQGATRVILHDCDLVPDDNLLAMYKEQWPRPIVHFGARFRRYNDSRTYFGGVHGFHVDAFPGYPNQFWGWGGEDDALRNRVDLRNTTYARKGEYLDLEGYTTAREKLNHLPHAARCGDKYEKIRSDNAAQDSHIYGLPRYTLRIKTETPDNVAWLFITFIRHEEECRPARRS